MNFEHLLTGTLQRGPYLSNNYVSHVNGFTSDKLHKLTSDLQLQGVPMLVGLTPVISVLD